jgi:RHS repeat-associated protein
MTHRNASWNALYTFSGKEKDVETGYGYFGARYYDSGLSIWLSVDPMSDKYPSMSPYNYCGNNPIILVDPDGRLLKLSGLLAETVYNIMVATNPNIQFSKNDGVVTAVIKRNSKGKELKLTKNEQKVFNAINDQSVEINLECTNWKMKDIDGNMLNATNGGVFLGNKLEGNIMKAMQGINLENAGKYIDASDFGTLINHEITEAHQGAIYSRSNGGYAKSATINPLTLLINSNPAYDEGHKNATPQPLTRLQKAQEQRNRENQYRQQQDDSIYNRQTYNNPRHKIF